MLLNWAAQPSNRITKFSNPVFWMFSAFFTTSWIQDTGCTFLMREFWKYNGIIIQNILANFRMCVNIENVCWPKYTDWIVRYWQFVWLLIKLARIGRSLKVSKFLEFLENLFWKLSLNMCALSSFKQLLNCIIVLFLGFLCYFQYFFCHTLSVLM